MNEEASALTAVRSCDPRACISSGESSDVGEEDDECCAVSDMRCSGDKKTSAKSGCSGMSLDVGAFAPGLSRSGDKAAFAYSGCSGLWRRRDGEGGEVAKLSSSGAVGHRKLLP